MAFICNLDLNGIIVPIITPVDKEENIDEKALRKQVDYVIKGGVSGILAYGSNGEFYMFNKKEKKEGFKIILDQNQGRVPVYFGIGEIRTKRCIELAMMAEELGADGVSIIQPMFLKPSEEELYYHFKAIADSIPNLSILLYNNPGRTAYTLSSNLVYNLTKDCPNIIGIKDSSGDITQTQEFIRVTKDFDFSVLGGKDTLIYATLAIGGCGAVCSTANIFPELVCGIHKKFVAGDLKGALEDQFILNPVRLCQDEASFPVATKDMANLMGLDIGNPIRPSLPSKGLCYETMKEEMKKAGIL